jgi:hypothetical protein
VVALSLVDPLNGAAVWREHVKHEAGHALGAILLGFTFDDVAMDRYPGDFDRWGQLTGLRRDPLTSEVRVSDDMFAAFEQFEYALYRDALDRSIVARLGVMTTLAQSWDGPGARSDRANVESNRPSEYSAGVWDFLVENAASRLLRRTDFRFKHAAVVRALDREGRLTFEPGRRACIRFPGRHLPSSRAGRMMPFAPPHLTAQGGAGRP